MKDKKENIILFGGSFDPIHNGHIRLAKAASRMLGGKVFFIPAKAPRWKHPSASPNDRENMIKAALNEINDPSLCFSDIELKRVGETTYTIDTVKEFKNLYPDSNLILLIGGDSVNTFDKWKDAEEISRLTRIVYIERDDTLVNEDNALRFQMEKLYYTGAGPVSSSGIRDLRTMDTPLSVIDYIEKNNLYFINNVRALLSHERFIHSLSVAHLSYDIALSNQFMNPDMAYIAGLLHDIGKNVEEKESRMLIEKNDPEYKDLPRYCLHQFVGEYFAKEKFGIENPLVLDAIKYHCTGKEHMPPLSKIIYAADKIEPTRGYDSSALIKKCKINYYHGFLEVLKHNKKFIDSKPNPGEKNKLSNQCFKSYLRSYK
ncbi:MAG: nicotinate (nicotinamide) nucleotide adenylyltransferase [Bacilli bacterium]|nr:nicotinate (nicotinamide) nucleotide adenylyltransferase [Bacilli bacterium]